ncbi:putative protein-serine/threonine phosphatase [Helianthus annuus]|nr:putative protein-serine/threonine phosphatase [Helianthus annuus]
MNRVYGSRKHSEEGEDTAVKCRERRRRRMAMRRMAVKREAGNQGIVNLEAPVYGTVSVVGRQREMVDEVSVQTNLCRPEINGFQPVHFFGVFDGHVSALCKELMHVIMKEEMMRVKVVGDGGGEMWRLAVNRSFHRMDEMAVKLCSSDICRCNTQLGSTAVVSVMTKEYMLVAKCGNSGAVICREGRPVDLTADDEGSCGGRIMSRPIDEIGFWASSEPDISVTKRESRDECLILGSNGLWDVVSSDAASKTVHQCLGENGNSNVELRIDTDVGTKLAATLLARLALGRRSADN